MGNEIGCTQPPSSRRIEHDKTLMGTMLRDPNIDTGHWSDTCVAMLFNLRRQYPHPLCTTRDTPTPYTYPDLHSPLTSTICRLRSLNLIRMAPTNVVLQFGCLLYLFFLCVPIHAQVPDVQQRTYASQLWTTANGLPVNQIYDIAQTEDGYIWLATPAGLVRFDGQTFTTFNPIDYPALPSNHIRRLFADSSGRLWIMTFSRHLVMYEKGTFTYLNETRGFPGQVTDFLIYTRPIYEDAQGTIWITHTNGVSHYQNGELRPFYPDQLDEQITSLYWDHEGCLWIGDHRYQVWQYHPDTGLQLIIRQDELISARRQVVGGTDSLNLWPWNMSHDSEGRLWIATESGPFFYKEDVLAFFAVDGKPFPFATRYIFEDAQHRLWFDDLYDSTNVLIDYQLVRPNSSIIPIRGRPFHRTTSDRRWTHEGASILFENREVYHFAEGTRAFSFYQDTEGSVWIGSTAGLLQLRPSPIGVIHHPIPDQYGAHTAEAYPILEDHTGTIWVGTLRDDLLTIKDQTIDVWPPSDQFFVGHPWTLMEDQEGTIWVGGYGIYSLNQATRSSAPIFPYIPGIGEIRTMIQDRTGAFWVGAEYGLARGVPGEEWHVFTEADGFFPFWIQTLHESTDGSIWIGTFGKGLFRYRDGTFEHWSTDSGFCSNNITSFYEDAANIHLWVTTSDLGICRISDYQAMSLTSATLSVLTSHHGLYSSSIHVLLEDDYDRFWMSTPQGIFWASKSELNAVANRQREHVVSVVYDERDGMATQSTSTNAQPAGIKDRQGGLWFPTQNGIVTIDPATVKQDAFLPPIHIETATIDEHMHAMPRALRLAPHQRAFTVTYTALSFVKSADIRFQYRLLGLGDVWQDAGTSRMAQFTNLDPGTYTFEVKAANSSGIWNETPARLTIIRQPFFYETALFNTFLVLGALIGGIGLFRYRTHRIRKRNLILEEKVGERTEALEHALVRVGEQAKELKALDEMKSQFFANVSHEFRTPLTLIRGHVADVQKARYGQLSPKAEKALSKSLTQTHRLQNLVEQLLDLSRLEANQLELYLEPDDLNAFLQRQVLYFSSLAEKGGITLRYEATSESVDTLFDNERMEKVITNLVGNALKFTPSGGSVTVKLNCSEATTHTPRRVTITVADTGIGMVPEVIPNVFKRFYQADSTSTRSYEGIGVGLALVKDLVELHGGTIRVESVREQGSTFTVVLPAPPVPQSDAVVDSDLLPSNKATPSSAARALDKEAAVNVMGRVMIVDDNADVRSYLFEHLHSSFDVIEAQDGQAAWDALQQAPVDAIVSDVMMPRMDGFTLLAKLKTHPQFHTIPILMLTARADEEDQLKGLEAKADAYMAKPFKIEELQLRVRNFVAARQAMQRQFQQQVVAVQAQSLDLKDEDTVFLERAQAIVEQCIEDVGFTVEAMAEHLHMSRMTLHRRIKSLTGLTPVAYIRTLRLERARQMLEQSSTQTISEVALAVGFRDANYFSRAYNKAYGVPPSAHVNLSSGARTES